MSSAINLKAAADTLKRGTVKLREVASGVMRFAKLERVLAGVCLLIPLLLIVFDDRVRTSMIRESISAYYNMKQSEVFYFPLTVASMLFVVNGVVKEKRTYNTILGIMLAGVILFNQDDFSILHKMCAAAFFLGNVFVILVYSSKREQLWFKISLAAIIVLALLAAISFHLWTLFWAEWLSFGIIAYHYILESLADHDGVSQSSERRTNR